MWVVLVSRSNRTMIVCCSEDENEATECFHKHVKDFYDKFEYDRNMLFVETWDEGRYWVEFIAEDGTYYRRIEIMEGEEL